MKSLTHFFISLGCVMLFVTPMIAAEKTPDDLARLRALGQAYMEEDDFKNAVQVYEQATALAPRSASDSINLGIAYYHGDQNEKSIQTLRNSLALDPTNLFTFYTLGLAHKKIGDSTAATEFFQKVADRDTSDVATLYNLGLALSKLGKTDAAIPWFQKTIELDSKHSSAFYQLLQFAIRRRDTQTAKELQKKFLELKKTEAQRPADAVDEGKYLGPIAFDIPPEQRPRFSSDLAVKFAPNEKWTQALQGGTSKPKPILTVYPDPQNRETVIILTTETQTEQWIITAAGEVRSRTKIHASASWSGCAVADYDGDNNLDLLLYSPKEVALLRNEGKSSWTDATAKAGIAASGARDALWVDFDHDGDLDLLLADPIGGDRIYRNNGNGTFETVTSTVQGLSLGKSVALAASDLDNDNDLDIIYLTADGQLEVFLNDRECRFTKAATYPKKLFQENQVSAAPKITAVDINNDSRMELIVTGVSTDAKGVFQFIAGKENSIQPMKEMATSVPATAVAALDANNDGFDDLLLTGEKGPTTLFVNQTPLGFKEVRDAIQIPNALQAAFPVDLDYDGDLDLLAETSESKIIALENQGGNQNHWLDLKINGVKNSTSGYGSKIQIQDGLFYLKQEVSSPQIHLGLGERKQADVLRLTWPNGIFQNMVHAAADQIHFVSEKPGYAGSCPFVYAWNGERFEFISDGLCTGPLGLYVGGGFFPPDSDEYVRVPGDKLMEKDNSLWFRFKEELREITYLDDLELLSVTHPAAVEVYANECFTLPPFPEFKLIGRSTRARPPRRVIDNHGTDVTELIREKDLRYPQPSGVGRYSGVGEEHWFEIDLGDFSDAKTLYLFMTGYVDWPNSSTARALEQNPSLHFVMPYLQVKNERGEWTTVKNPMGFPAGKLKTVPLDLSNIFLSKDRTLRIVSTLQVYWDQILVDPAPILTGFEIRRHPLQSAELQYGGYSREYDLASAGPHWYDYTQPTGNLRWDHQLGLYTRYGNVLPLLQGFDDRYVIMGDGDEIAARFAALPIESGKVCTYFLHLTGWVKDADYSTAYGATVEPLPFKGMSAYPYRADEHYPYDENHLQYLLEYNTRAVTRQNDPLTIPKMN